MQKKYSVEALKSMIRSQLVDLIATEFPELDNSDSKSKDQMRLSIYNHSNNVVGAGEAPAPVFQRTAVSDEKRKRAPAGKSSVSISDVAVEDRGRYAELMKITRRIDVPGNMPQDDILSRLRYITARNQKLPEHRRVTVSIKNMKKEEAIKAIIDWEKMNGIITRDMFVGPTVKGSSSASSSRESRLDEEEDVPPVKTEVRPAPILKIPPPVARPPIVKTQITLEEEEDVSGFFEPEQTSTVVEEDVSGFFAPPPPARVLFQTTERSKVPPPLPSKLGKPVAPYSPPRQKPPRPAIPSSGRPPVPPSLSPRRVRGPPPPIPPPPPSRSVPSRCYAGNDYKCPIGNMCNVETETCIPNSQVLKDNLQEITYKGNKIVGSPRALEKFRESCKDYKCSDGNVCNIDDNKCYAPKEITKDYDQFEYNGLKLFGSHKSINIFKNNLIWFVDEGRYLTFDEVNSRGLETMSATIKNQSVNLAGSSMEIIDNYINSQTRVVRKDPFDDFEEVEEEDINFDDVPPPALPQRLSGKTVTTLVDRPGNPFVDDDDDGPPPMPTNKPNPFDIMTKPGVIQNLLYKIERLYGDASFNEKLKNKSEREILVQFEQLMQFRDKLVSELIQASGPSNYDSKNILQLQLLQSGATGNITANTIARMTHELGQDDNVALRDMNAIQTNVLRCLGLIS